MKRDLICKLKVGRFWSGQKSINRVSTQKQTWDEKQNNWNGTKIGTPFFFKNSVAVQYCKLANKSQQTDKPRALEPHQISDLVVCMIWWFEKIKTTVLSSNSQGKRSEKIWWWTWNVFQHKNNKSSFLFSKLRSLLSFMMPFANTSKRRRRFSWFAG